MKFTIDTGIIILIATWVIFVAGIFIISRSLKTEHKETFEDLFSNPEFQIKLKELVRSFNQGGASQEEFRTETFENTEEILKLVDEKITKSTGNYYVYPPDTKDKEVIFTKNLDSAGPEYQENTSQTPVLKNLDVLPINVTKSSELLVPVSFKPMDYFENNFKSFETKI